MAIDTDTFQYQKSRWQDIYLCLKEHGFDVYSPGQKQGECTSPYVVVKNDGGYRHFDYSSMREQYSVTVFVPRTEYSKLEVLVMEVREAMKSLYPMILDYGQMQPSQYDDTTKSHSQTIEYENYKKL